MHTATNLLQVPESRFAKHRLNASDSPFLSQPAALGQLIREELASA
jgi:hypothetical protein